MKKTGRWPEIVYLRPPAFKVKDVTLTNVLLVAAGGAVGAAMRYGLTFLPFKGVFPGNTFLTNILGALLIGAVIGFISDGRLGSGGGLFFKTGVCGGLTTFSTFSSETLSLLENGEYFIAGAYAVGSVIGCVAGVALGRIAVK